MDDRALVARMLAGDEEAFDAFYGLYFPRLFRFAVRHLGDEDAAEDVVQVTLVTGVRKLAAWRGEAALLTWLCTICRREIGDYFRRTSRQPRLQPLDHDPELRGSLESLQASHDAPERQIERRELADRVHLTLDYLPGRYGDVLEWKYIHGLTVAEIAARLGATPKAVESMLTRAREAFREGFTSITESNR